MFRKIWQYRWALRSIFCTLYFNFHYLPVRQAVKLPILLYKPKLIKCKGKIRIDGEIKTGMILLGKNRVSIFPNNGIAFENHGGVIVFKGKCDIGNNSAISIGEKAYVEFGSRFSASTTFKLVSYHKVIFQECVLIGWDCLFMDTDFHKMTKLKGGYTKGFGEINIGKANWFGTKCICLKNTSTPDYCIISAATLLNKNIEAPEYSIISSNTPAEIKITGLWRNIDDDSINYNRL